MLSDTAYNTSPTFTVPSDYAGQGGGKGLHLLNASLAGVAIQDFRDAVEHSATVDELQSRVAALADAVARRAR